MNKIFMGWDGKEQLAYDVAEYSILSRSPNAVVTPLKLDNLPMLTRPIEKKDGKLYCPISQASMATEFAISRFCVPFIEDKGWALFIDCDIVCLTDIQELFDLADDNYAVMVVKHKQETGAATKMDGQVQTYYNRKNWSSVVLWNCDHTANKRLTLEDLNTWPGRDLHAFKWLEDNEIGELPKEWNHLVGVQGINENAKILHFTLGGGWFKEWNSKYPEDKIWDKERKAYILKHHLVVY